MTEQEGKMTEQREKNRNRTSEECDRTNVTERVRRVQELHMKNEPQFI